MTGFGAKVLRQRVEDEIQLSAAQSWTQNKKIWKDGKRFKAANTRLTKSETELDVKANYLDAHVQKGQDTFGQMDLANAALKTREMPALFYVTPH